jgi:hypothetical protein
MRKRTVVICVMLVAMGLNLFLRVISSPLFDTYRGFDVVSLIVAGACFGMALGFFGLGIQGRIKPPRE